LTFTVDKGEILALLGPNGAGKTTTVRMLSSILRPSSGSARVGGLDVVRDAQRVRRMVGHLTETPGLYLRMSALDYLDFFGELQRMRRAERRARAEELLTRFGLFEARHRRLGDFSKGMKQKVALVRAMLHHPQVLFLDEPTSAMDPQSIRQVHDVIRDFRSDCRTIILCTHNLHEAEILADRIAVIRRGEMLALGSPQQLKRDLLGSPLWEIRLAQPLGTAWPLEDEETVVVAADGTAAQYRTSQPDVVNPRLLNCLHDLGASVISLQEVPRSLEQVYLKLVEEDQATGQEPQ
jgi:ABC-2 type transport system ATP-binding protein